MQCIYKMSLDYPAVPKSKKVLIKKKKKIWGGFFKGVEEPTERAPKWLKFEQFEQQNK